MEGHWKKQFNYDYLGSHSIDKETIATISKIDMVDLVTSQGKKERCMTILFKEFDKPMIVNRTNAKAIEKVCNSPMLEDWFDKQVYLYVEKGIKAFGESVDGLRIRDIKVEKMQYNTKVENAMLNAIKSGKYQQVESALHRYDIDNVKQHKLTKAIKDAKSK